MPLVKISAKFLLIVLVILLLMTCLEPRNIIS